MPNQTSWALNNYKNLCIHIFCYHGLGDAIRYAVPLAHAFHRSGAEVFLHIRDVLTSTIGPQPQGINIAAVSDDFISCNGGPQKAMRMLLSQLPRPDFAVGLGGSFLDVEAAKSLQKSEVPYLGVECQQTSQFYSASQYWLNTLQIYKNQDKLFELLGLEPMNQDEILINPQPSTKFSLPENTVGLHTKAMWPARCYNQRENLLELISQKYHVWNFDDPPCKSVADLAWYIKHSKAVLSVDTMVQHLCTALNIPVLIMQGPVWQHPDNAPNVIDFTRTTEKPMLNSEIDKQSDALSKIPPERILEAFEEFIDSLD